MIGLDTNVLVRYLAQDDAAQSARAAQVIEQQLTEEQPGFISLITIVETVWVLDSVYALSSGQVAAAVESILQADTLLVQNEQQVFEAAVSLKAGNASFADALIGALGRWSGCRTTLTFDKRAGRLRDFEALP